MAYKLGKVIAGTREFTVVSPAVDSTYYSPTPKDTIHVVLNLADSNEGLDDALMCLVPATCVEDIKLRREVRTVVDEDVDNIKSLKEIDKWFTSLAETQVEELVGTESISFIIDMFEHAQKAWLRVKKSPTEEGLAAFTDKLFKKLKGMANVVVYIHTGDVEEPQDSGLVEGWAFRNYVINLTK